MGEWTGTADIPDLRGTNAVVTGANSGLGYVTARELARRGARVVLACRDEGRGRDAAERIAHEVSGADTVVQRLDLADLASVREFADACAGEISEGLDLLVNNAGVMALPERSTADGFEMQIGTNHLGHFALTARLAPLLLSRPGARVVTVSSGMHLLGAPDPTAFEGGGRYHKWLAYGRSKSANLMFMYELAERARAARLDLVSVSAHPGYAATNLQAAGPRMAGDRRGERMMELGNRFATSPEAGALPQLYAATAGGVRSGEFFGPRFGMAGRPARSPRAPWTRNRRLTRALWEASTRATSVEWPKELA